nr:DVUA0089 family protein [Nitrosospira multiformis]
MRRNKNEKIHAAILAIGFVTGSVNAANFSFTGNFEHDNEVQEFNFAVVGPASAVALRTWSSAGGINATGTEID